VGIKIENSFVVPASIEEAWKVLVDVPRVVPCMPGTELTEMLDERRFRATARLRVGPIELLFKGEGELYDVNAAACTARLRAKGADTKGRGAFQSQMAFALTSRGPETLVRVDSDLTLSGSVAQHARGAGLVKEMAQQLAGQFARNLGKLISAQSAPASGAALNPPAGESRHPAAVSGFALLLAALKAILRGWFGRRS
jgi:carbon monoxide dehydrogenase subunit G